MEYKGFELEFNPSDILLGFSYINGVEKGGRNVRMFTMGILIGTITWVWE